MNTHCLLVEVQGGGMVFDTDHGVVLPLCGYLWKQGGNRRSFEL